MTLIRNLKDISKDDVLIAGGKGASLGEMIKKGIPVPEGFVISSDLFDNFLEENNIKAEINNILDKINFKKIDMIDKASSKIKELIISKEISEKVKKEILNSYKMLNNKFVAVRSSATSEDSVSDAWAGQLDSFLNTTENRLLENIKKCWASLFNSRAIFYRFERKLEKSEISVAVVVQEMIEAEKSGVIFSVNPLSKDTNQIFIEATFGLGEAIVSGAITPDSYIVNKKKLVISNIVINDKSKALYNKSEGGTEWKNLGEISKKQVLNDDEIRELAKITLKIENHYNFPCDIEWVKKDKRYYLVQARPITTLNAKINSFNKLDELFNYDWKMLVKRESTFLERDLRTIGYFDMLPKPYTVKLKDLLAIYENGFTTQYVREDDYSSKENDLNNDIKNIGFKEMYSYWNKIISDLAESSKVLLEGIKLTNWQSFVKNYKLARGIILYSFYVAAHLKKHKIHLEELDNLQKFYDNSEKICLKSWDNMSLYLNMLSKKYNILKDKLLYYKNKEIEDLHKNNFLVDEKKLDERVNSLFLIYNYNNYFYQGNSVKNFSKKLNLVLSKLDSDELKGSAIINSNCVGEIRVINSKNDLKSIKTGEIIVLSMTTPDMVPYLSNVAGIITDEGGALCHATIISREMNKPCIVGTKNATKILKDGDIVKINSMKGIVEILKKN